MQSYNIAFIGPKSGKSCYRRRLCLENFSDHYAPTYPFDVDNYIHYRGEYSTMFTIWDYESDETIYDAYVKGKEAILVFYDLTTDETLKSDLNIINRYQHLDVPILLCGLKSDLILKETFNQKFNGPSNIPHFIISSKNLDSTYQPFDYLCEILDNQILVKYAGKIL